MFSFRKMLAATLLLLSGTILFAEEQTKSVIAEGVGESLKLAIKDARKNAIRQACGELVDSKSEAINDEFLESTITVSAGFIKSGRMLQRQKDAQTGVWNVKIQAVVAVDRLKPHINRFRKTTTNVDIKTQIAAANDAETQEKNAMKLLQWWTKAFYKTISFSDVKIESEKGNLVLYFTEKQNGELAKSMAQEVARVLAANGYKRTLMKGNRGSGNLDPNQFSGSTFATNYVHKGGYADNNEYEVFNNPNACLFWGDGRNKHPQNFAAHCFKSHIEVVAVKQDNSKTVLAIQNLELRDMGIRDARVRFHFADETCEVCSLLPMVFPRTINSLNGTYKKVISQNDIAGAVSLQVNAVHVAENGTGDTETVTLANFPLANAGQLASDAAAQKESLAQRSQGLSDLIIKYGHDIYKCIKCEASFKYNRFKKNGVLEVTLSSDAREYANWNRGFISKLEALNLSVKEEGRSMTPRRKPGATTLLVKYKWHTFIPDADNAIAKKVAAEFRKYQPKVVVSFKDASGEVLQRKKFLLGADIKNNRDGHFQYGNSARAWLGTYGSENVIFFGLDWGESENRARKQYTREFYINFDVPEDAQKVSTVECVIAEEEID